jgi:hypothetical protein
MVDVGPESVGHRLLKEGLVFGGSTLTATEIVVASGKDQIGDVPRVKDVPPEIVEAARVEIKHLLEGAIDSMKLSAEDCICILVGGGSIVQMDPLKGVGEIIRPQFHDCANAVGAVIARVSGQVDIVKVLESQDEDKILEEVCEEARQKAIDAGADSAKVKITEVENLRMQYVQMRASRIIVKAAGPLSAKALLRDNPVVGKGPAIDSGLESSNMSSHAWSKGVPNAEKNLKDFIVSPSSHIDIASYRPEVDTSGVWWVSEVDCEFLATGSSILACGGGGPCYMCYMAARDAIQKGARMPIVDISLLPDDAWIMGKSPTALRR